MNHFNENFKDETYLCFHLMTVSSQAVGKPGGSVSAFASVFNKGNTFDITFRS